MGNNWQLATSPGDGRCDGAGDLLWDERLQQGVLDDPRDRPWIPNKGRTALVPLSGTTSR